MALATWQATVQDSAGEPIVSPVVTVRENNESGDLAELFDVDGAPIANPVTGTVTGFVQFAAAQGLYWVQAASGGNLTEPWYWDAVPFDVEPLTAAEVKTAYESNANTNAFTDAEKTKLAGIEAGADVNPTDAEIAASYASVVPQVSGAERTAGTETAVRRFSPEDVAVMAAAHGGGGSSGSMSFASRADAKDWIDANTPSDGFMVHWPDASVVADASSSVISDMPGFKPPLGPWTPQHFGDINGTSDSTVIQAMWDATTNGQGIMFPGDIEYGINASISATMADREVLARGARFKVGVNSYAFDFNPDANPASVESGQKSYGKWVGGTFTGTVVSPTATAAFRIYACRQMSVHDCVFGDLTGSMIYGIQVSAMGGHYFENCRFLHTVAGFYCPLWAVDGPGQPISTSLFVNCNFILDDAANHKCVYNECGANRWTFQNGFCNGTTGSTFHFTNSGSEAVREIVWNNFGFEQGISGGKFVYFEDADPTHSAISNVTFNNCEFGGNPSAVGTHIHVDCERVKKVTFNNVRATADQGNGNWSLRCDADCEQIVATADCRWFDNSLVTDEMLDLSLVPRGEIYFPDKYFTPTLFTSINGSSYSTGTSTINMPTLISSQYPQHGVQPRGYTLQVRCRDSGSSGTSDRRIRLYASGTIDAAKAEITLDGVRNDVQHTQTMYVPASDDGTIEMDIFASGTNTFDVWIRCSAIHN